MSSSEDVVVCAFGDDTPVERGRAFPEIHGGPEGAYEKDRSTGRWRSVSRGGTVRSRGSKEATENRIVPGTRRAFDEALDYRGSAPTEGTLQKEADDIEVDPEQEEEAAALRQQAAAARAETQRLWQALTDVVSDASQVNQLKRDGQMSRLQAEADFESQRRDAVWQLLKEGLDMGTFTALTRKATGCEGEKALSIGAGVRLFEKAAEPAQDAGGYSSGSSAARAATPSKLRRSASRSSLQSGRASSNTRNRDAAAPNMSLPGAFAFGHRGKLDMEQLKKDMKDTQVGKEVAPATQKGALTRSDSVVKMRVRDFEPKAANGGA